MPRDDFEEALQAERSGDAADERQSAAGYYGEAQRLLLPPGIVWTCREEYDRRMEAFERIQQKIYGLQDRGNYAIPAPSQSPETVISVVPASEPSPSPTPDLTVWDFYPGLAVRISQDFIDYDGQQIHAGEVLHLLDRNYFPYDSGHTLRFAEKTIRLAGIVDEHEAIIKNAGNAWFQPIL